jgi:hypothetical protein
MPDMISALNTTIEDMTPSVFRDAGPIECPILEKADRTEQNVQASDGSTNDLGQLYKVKHAWKTGSAGMIRSINPYGSDTLDVGTEARILDNLGSAEGMSPFPPAGESPLPGDFVRVLYLSACAGNFPIPLHWSFADKLTAQKLKQVSRIIMAAGQTCRKQDAQSYYGYRATNASGFKTTVLSRAVSFTKATHATRAGSTNANFVDIVIDPKYGTIEMFQEGQEIDVVANSGGSTTVAGTLQDGTDIDGTDVRNCASGTTPVQLVVTKVDRHTNTITVIGVTRNSTLSSAAADAVAAYDTSTHGWTVDQSNKPAAYDWICPRNVSRYSTATRPWLTHGVFDWVASSGYIMGGAQYGVGLDLAEYPQFKSITHTASAPLDENLLNRISIASSTRFKNVKINTWQTTPGVLLKFSENLKESSTSNFERSAMELKVKGGWSVANYVTPQGSYEWWTSPYMHEGKMIGQQMDKENLKMYSNAIIGDQQTGFGANVQFVGRMLGYPTSKVPETALNGTPKTVSGMPWIRFALLCPIMPNGWLIDGITEADVINFT